MTVNKVVHEITEFQWLHQSLSREGYLQAEQQETVLRKT